MPRWFGRKEEKWDDRKMSGFWVVIEGGRDD
jgi:hypothetical protein